MDRMFLSEQKIKLDLDQIGRDGSGRMKSPAHPVGADIARRRISKPKLRKKNLAFQGTPVKTSAHRTGADIARRIIRMEDALDG